MTSVYNGRIDAANKTDGRNFGIVWDGSLFTIDSWVILAGSENLEQAYTFLDYVGKPEVQARLPAKIAYGVPAKGVNALVDPERVKDLPTADENIANAREISTSFWLENVDRLTERFNKWAAVN
jgi:putative spermidine/putrescine transport system substrate-binding protein